MKASDKINTAANNNNSNNDTDSRRVKELLMYRNNIKRNSTSSKILEMLYDDCSNNNNNDISEFPLSYVSKRIRKPYRFTKKIFLELKYSGCLASRQRGMYSITQKGRWFALCQKLDGISFLSLCLLAETYHRVKSNPEFFCQLSSFRDYYQRDCRDDAHHNNESTSTLSVAIYHRTNISKSLHHLTSRNLVYVVSGDFIKMTKPTIEFLRTYDDDFESLFLWCGDTFEKYVDHVIDNNKLGFDISRINISKGSN
ncbi:MAG: hypothetical protein OEL52_01100 [Nitrosopumilus sp.]|nr:hypothetical protein [Nitrosopumilus sp.]